VFKILDVLRDWFAAHGIPEQLVTDNGPQFIADETKSVSSQSVMNKT